MDADIGALAREGRRHVVNVSAATIAVYDRAHRKAILDNGDIDYRLNVGIRIAVRGHSVAAFYVAFRTIQLRLVGDVADNSRLGSRPEQSALRALENLDPIEIGRVNVE